MWGAPRQIVQSRVPPGARFGSTYTKKKQSPTCSLGWTLISGESTARPARRWVAPWLSGTKAPLQEGDPRSTPVLRQGTCRQYQADHWLLQPSHIPAWPESPATGSVSIGRVFHTTGIWRGSYRAMEHGTHLPAVCPTHRSWERKAAAPTQGCPPRSWGYKDITFGHQDQVHAMHSQAPQGHLREMQKEQLGGLWQRRTSHSTITETGFALILMMRPKNWNMLDTMMYVYFESTHL